MIIKILAILTLTLSATSCLPIWKKSTTSTTYTNTLTPQAKIIDAKYSKQYNLSGDVIASYPDFRIHLVSTQIKGDQTTSLFEISSKNNGKKHHIRCSTSDPEKQHIFIEDIHLYYHSESPGKINFYFPPLLIASLPTTNNTNTNS